MRHLALPAICLVVVGGLVGWFGRSAFLTWLLKHTADTPIIGPPTPQALDRSLLELALGFGVMLALPLLWWQACTLLTPATIERVKSRLAAYLCVSFALLFANPVTVLVQTSERGSVDLSATQDRLVCALGAEPIGGPVKCSRALPVNEYVSGFSFAFLGCAWVASLLTPIFILSRFHPPSVHQQYLTILLAWSGGSVLFPALTILAELSLPPRHVSALSLATAVAALATPLVVLRCGRRAFRRWPLLVGLALGSSALVFAQRWFFARTGLLGMCVLAVYWPIVGLGLGLRRASAERPRAECR